MEHVVRPLVYLKDEHVSQKSAVAPVPVTTPPQAVMEVAVVASGDDFVLASALPTLFALHGNHHLPK